MACGCKKKRGSGLRGKILSGVTWKGYGPYKKGSGVRRRKRKRGSGVVLHGNGVVIHGNGISMKGGRHHVTGRRVTL